MSPKAIIITGYGINCEEETAFCFKTTGTNPTIIHINDIIQNPKLLNDYQIMAFPGGFSYGDDTGSGNALANKIKNNIYEEILTFASKDKLIIGICNGFQILSNLGLVPATDKIGIRESVLMHNKTLRYECRWIKVKVTSEKCIWTKGVNAISLPIAHGEGNFFAPEKIIKEMTEKDQIALKYVKEDLSPALEEFPYNPNGAMLDIAGICDPTGKIFGLMPHPERFNSYSNQPGWNNTNTSGTNPGEGLKIFQNAYNYFS